MIYSMFLIFDYKSENITFLFALLYLAFKTAFGVNFEFDYLLGESRTGSTFHPLFSKLLSE